MVWRRNQKTCGGVRAVAPGPANLWCYGRGGFRANSSVLVWARWLQGQQTCADVGAVAPEPTNLYRLPIIPPKAPIIRSLALSTYIYICVYIAIHISVYPYIGVSLYMYMYRRAIFLGVALRKGYL